MSIGRAIEVLNSGFVRLVDHMGDDLSIVRSARVSYNAEWRTGEDAGKDAKLINYLVKNKHTSPLEAVTFTFEVKAPIFVIRQWHRHRTWAYNEVSARYSELPEEFYIPQPQNVTTQSTDNKQMRTTTMHEEADFFSKVLKIDQARAFGTYKELLAAGCPRELARMVLPLGTYTHMFATVNLHNLLHFLKLRMHEHSQYEIRVYAEAIASLIADIVPVTLDAWFTQQAEEAKGKQ